MRFDDGYNQLERRNSRHLPPRQNLVLHLRIAFVSKRVIALYTPLLRDWAGGLPRIPVIANEGIVALTGCLGQGTGSVAIGSHIAPLRH